MKIDENIAGKVEDTPETATEGAKEEKILETGSSEENPNQGTEVKTEPKVENVTSTKAITDKERFNEIIRERLRRDREKLFKDYGVQNQEELDALVGKGEKVNPLEERLSKLSEEVQSYRLEKTFAKNKIRPEKQEDVKIYFKGKGIDLNDDNLTKELATHEEWISKSPSVSSLGTDGSHEVHRDSDKEYAEKCFGFKL